MKNLRLYEEGDVIEDRSANLVFHVCGRLPSGKLFEIKHGPEGKTVDRIRYSGHVLNRLDKIDLREVSISSENSSFVLLGRIDELRERFDMDKRR